MRVGMQIPVSFVVLVLLFSSSADGDDKPHIIYILADDLGWNDVSFHGSPQIPTPNLDALAASGVVLQNFYAATVCSPSRGSLMTGRYPINIGLQHLLIFMGEPSGLPLNFTIMPQFLKQLGYSTNLIGKWHLGSHKKEYTPTYRGFDKFFGYMNGRIDYYDYTSYLQKDGLTMWGVDLYDGVDIIKNFRGKYATDLFTEKALDVIKEHNTSQPLFLYLSTISPHSGNPYAPLQAPPEDVAKFKHITDLKRRTYAGMVSKLDEQVGRIFQSLNERDMLNNSIIVFTGDNGGPAGEYSKFHASNWPLRGEKYTLFEGGVRVPALIWSPLLKLKEPAVSSRLMHISDWLPTLYYAAGGDLSDLGSIDGENMWPHLLTSDNNMSPRGIPLNIDPILSSYAIRVGDYKLIGGAVPPNSNLWYSDSGKEEVELESTLDNWVWKDGCVVRDILKNSSQWLVKSDDSWRVNLTVSCGDRYQNDTVCDPSAKPCLYNIARDPCEYHDLAEHFPKVVKEMMELMKRYNSTSWPSVSKPLDPKADPLCHGFGYISWMDEENQSNCPYY